MCDVIYRHRNEMKGGEHKMSKVMFLRRGYGLTQDYVSKKLGISRPTLSRKEKGKIDWTKGEMETLTKLFKEYDPDCTVEKIFFADNFTI